MRRCIEPFKASIFVRFCSMILKIYSFCSVGSEKDIEKSQKDCQIVCDAYEESSRPCSNETEQLSLSLSIIIIIVFNWIINK